MAITGAALQAALGTNPMNARVTQEFGVISTFQEWYVVGMGDAVGRDRLIRTTAANSAANQAVEVLAALRAT